VGIGIGFGSSNMLNQQSVNVLQEEIDKINAIHDIAIDRVQELGDKLLANEEYLKIVENKYTDLKETYDSLANDNIALVEYEKLTESYNELRNEKNSMEEHSISLENQLSALNSSYIDLETNFNELTKDYILVNGPLSTFTSFEDLDFTFSTDKSIYNYTESLSGNFSVYYKDGSPFVGRVKLYVGGSSGWSFNVNGEGYFFIESPVFKYGPQKYDVGFYYLYDSDGFIVADAGQIRHIKVTVEAK